METREEAIARWEREGWLDRDCPGCQDFYTFTGYPFDYHAPNHKASPGCESGKRPHCTCASCW